MTWWIEEGSERYAPKGLRDPPIRTDSTDGTKPTYLKSRMSLKADGFNWQALSIQIDSPQLSRLAWLTQNRLSYPYCKNRLLPRVARPTNRPRSNWRVNRSDWSKHTAHIGTTESTDVNCRMNWPTQRSPATLFRRDSVLRGLWDSAGLNLPHLAKPIRQTQTDWHDQLDSHGENQCKSTSPTLPNRLDRPCQFD